MKSISPETERRLLLAVKQATLAVEDEGLTPSQAVVKVARHFQLAPTMLPLVVQALNTGRQTHQRQTSSGLFDKLASFPLADLAEVHRELYPTELPIKAAVSNEYDLPPQPLAKHVTAVREKVASAVLDYDTPKPEPYPRDPAAAMARAYSQSLAVKRAAERQRAAYRHAEDEFQAALGKLAMYFQQPAFARLPFAEVEVNAGLLFGKTGEAAMEYAYAHNVSSGRREKRAAEVTYAGLPVDRQSAPYTLLADIVKQGQALLDAWEAWQTKQAAATVEIEELLRPYDRFEVELPLSVLTGEPRGTQKSAGRLSDMLAAGFGGSLAGGFQHANNAAVGRPTDELAEQAEQSLLDTSHENALRAIQAKAELADFMANDEVIKTYDPHQVLQAYNELAKLSPHSSTQPALMRPLLRRQLAQGSVEPHEVQQMTEIESTLGGNAGNLPTANRAKPPGASSHAQPRLA